MSLTQGLQLPFGIQPVNPVPVDAWSGPYEADTAQDAIDAANAAITSSIRFQSMEVRLIIGGVAHKYWYRDGVGDSDLVEFESGSGSGGVDLSGYAQLSGATFSGDLVASGSLFGSLTRLADGETPYLIGGDGVSVVTGSNGQLQISLTNSAPTVTELVLNEEIAGDVDGSNQAFTLANDPASSSSVMIWLNGQLLTQGSGRDYTVSGRSIQIGFPPVAGDVLLGMYSKLVTVKQFSLNETASFITISGSLGLEIAHTPNPASSLMLFMNGQLLTQGDDYTLSSREIQIGSIDASDVFLATYTYTT